MQKNQECAHCGDKQVELQCGNKCGTTYCSEECGKEHWNIEHGMHCDLSEKRVSREKAREILHRHSVYGHPLTKKQRRYFGFLANE